MSNMILRRTCMSKVRKLTKSLNNTDVKEIINDFLSFCEAQGLGQDSLRSHRYALQHFFNENDVQIGDEIALKKALGNMLQGKQDAYYNKQLNGIRKFFDYCIQEKLMKSDPALAFKYYYI